MVEMKKHDKIKKLDNRYIHTIKITYPTSNVSNMMKSWEEKIKESQSFLDRYDEQIVNLTNAGHLELDAENEKIRKQLEELRNLPEDQLIIKLKEANQKFIEEQEKYLVGLDIRKEEFKEQILKQMSGYKNKVAEDIKQKKEALQVWQDASR